mmetsp:Transcript_95871/g.140057  ORF Transcript_95871/g.140057 Transcript_95871/m.140057 type:complete len:122 (-) Transcript_95871:70-435(-)
MSPRGRFRKKARPAPTCAPKTVPKAAGTRERMLTVTLCLFASAFPASTLQAAQTPLKFSAWKHACSPGTDPCAHAHIHTQHSKRRNNWHQKHDRRLESSLEGLFYAAVRDWRVRVIAATMT